MTEAGPQTAGSGWMGMGDGVAECYYFNGDGYMLANTTTPDGYTVNADGAWTVNGVVQTQGVVVNTSNTGVANTGNYDPQYPLAGMLDQLGLNFAKNPNGIDMLYYSQDYQSDTYGFDAAPVNRWQKAKETNNLGYYYGIGQNFDEMLAIENWQEGQMLIFLTQMTQKQRPWQTIFVISLRLFQTGRLPLTMRKQVISQGGLNKLIM